MHLCWLLTLFPVSFGIATSKCCVRLIALAKDLHWLLDVQAGAELDVGQASPAVTQYVEQSGIRRPLLSLARTLVTWVTSVVVRSWHVRHHPVKNVCAVLGLYGFTQVAWRHPRP